ncbi:hypothetical protein [Pararhizobium sp.]|uniref:hypothetical protein n=1 Tax=Pararhizobium sp. TaxID=1977563 RepID=UPI0027248508|nr:hypothetical protein [Pararhizobium sp.]MDO9417176.1 hypothetical protein [Pararhizobium sp.]
MYETLMLVAALVWFGSILWLAVSALRIVLVPAWRKSGRRQAGLAALLFIGTFVVTLLCSHYAYKDYGLESAEGLEAARTARNAQKRQDAAKAEAIAVTADEPAQLAGTPEPACKAGAIMAIDAGYELRRAAGETAEKIVNEKATAALGKTHFQSVDTSTVVRVDGCEKGWAEVSITEPEWLNTVHGWIPETVLRAIERSGDGSRVYVENDVLWDKDTTPHKQAILTMVNRISREHTGCASIDPGSVALSSSKSKPKKPVFFITCDPSGAPFNVWFSPSDIGKPVTAAAAIGRGDAVLACEQAAKAKAAHPSTVDFSKILDVAYQARGDGRVSLDSSFTAKNGFDLALKYRIRCLFDGGTMIEATVSEAG